jgi:hypothetical protein
MDRTEAVNRREVAVERALARGEGVRLAEIAESCGVKLHTLKGWLKARKKVSGKKAGSVRYRTLSERLEALNETSGMSDEALSAWCRSRGLYAHQLAEWRAEFLAPRAAESEALRALRSDKDRLTKELARKEKALAEAAALLVLQKKFQGLLSGEAT